MSSTFATTTGDRAEPDVTVGVSFDGAWQKRGRAHNSLTGCGAAISIKSKKNLSYGTRNKWCATCHVAHLAGREPPTYDCRMNWDKSSKAMEASIACEVVKEVNESGAGVRVGVLVGDDASTIKNVRQEVDVSIEKWSDISHVKRSLGNQLYSAKSHHKELSDMVIKHIQRCFVYCLAQNRDKPVSLADGIHNIPCHIFGEHDDCGDWCGFRKKS